MSDANCEYPQCTLDGCNPKCGAASSSPESEGTTDLQREPATPTQMHWNACGKLRGGPCNCEPTPTPERVAELMGGSAGVQLDAVRPASPTGSSEGPAVAGGDIEALCRRAEGYATALLGHGDGASECITDLVRALRASKERAAPSADASDWPHGFRKGRPKHAVNCDVLEPLYGECSCGLWKRYGKPSDARRAPSPVPEAGPTPCPDCKGRKVMGLWRPAPASHPGGGLQSCPACQESSEANIAPGAREAGPPHDPAACGCEDHHDFCPFNRGASLFAMEECGEWEWRNVFGWWMWQHRSWRTRPPSAVDEQNDQARCLSNSALRARVASLEAEVARLTRIVEDVERTVEGAEGDGIGGDFERYDDDGNPRSIDGRVERLRERAEAAESENARLRERAENAEKTAWERGHVLATAPNVEANLRQKLREAEAALSLSRAREEALIEGKVFALREYAKPVVWFVAKENSGLPLRREDGVATADAALAAIGFGPAFPVAPNLSALSNSSTTTGPATEPASPSSAPTLREAIDAARTPSVPATEAQGGPPLTVTGGRDDG